MTIRLLAMDVDGTLTDGSINISDCGELFKRFNVKDGAGIGLIRKTGVITAIITGRESKIVENRATELNVDEVYQGVVDKMEVLKNICLKYGFSRDEIAYIGDDVNDLSAMEFAGISFCPSDAVDAVIEKADVILESSGGHGAVRQCIDYIININKTDE